MTLEYDFDIHPSLSLEGEMPQGHDGAQAGAATLSEGNGAHVALFRNPETVEALCSMPKSFRTWFAQAGFGLDRYEDGAAPGRYHAQEEEARLAIIDRLADTTPDFSETDKEAIKDGAFDLDAFIEAFSRATPLSDEAEPEPLDAFEADLSDDPGTFQNEIEPVMQGSSWPSPDDRDFGVPVLPPELGLSPDFAMPKASIDPRLMVIGGLAAITVLFILLV